jgi:hypothetical protein
MYPRCEQHRRRYRHLGLLPALVLVGGGLSLGLAQRGWLGQVISAMFLLLSAIMIAADRPSDPYGEPTEGSRSQFPHDPALRPGEKLPGYVPSWRATRLRRSAAPKPSAALPTPRRWPTPTPSSPVRLGRRAATPTG